MGNRASSNDLRRAIQRLAVGFLTRYVVPSLHSLCKLIIDCTTLEFCGSAALATLLQIFAGVSRNAIRKRHPTIEKTAP